MNDNGLKRLQEEVLGIRITETDDLMLVLKKLNSTKGGIIINLPWNYELNGEYQKYIQVLAIKVTKNDLFFLNPLHATKIDTDNNTIKEDDGMDSIPLKDLIQIHKRDRITAFI